MDLQWNGLILGVATFLTIGAFHPLVIKTEYYFGVKKSWWVFLLGAFIFIYFSLTTEDIVWSSVFGVIAFSLFWSIGELFEQEKRVKKGWFPKNPNRKYDDSDEKTE